MKKLGINMESFANLPNLSIDTSPLRKDAGNAKEKDIELSIVGIKIDSFGNFLGVIIVDVV